MQVRVEPAEYDSVELQINSHYEYRDGDWHPSEKDPIVLRTRVRPGYLIGTRHENFVIGSRAGRQRVTSGIRGGTWDTVGGAFGRAAGNADSVYSDLTVFETSDHQIHLWQPESGDYRVLWQGRISGGRRRAK
jgi:hypothetical protein